MFPGPRPTRASPPPPRRTYGGGVTSSRTSAGSTRKNSMLRDAVSVTSIPPKRSRLYRGGIHYIQNYNSVKEVFNANKRMPFDNDAVEELAVDPLVSDTARTLAGGRPRERRILRRAYTQSRYRARVNLHDNRRKHYGIR
ncbi:hypothetical protein Z517_03857 [Fonsecaea pedrosoi CBS 271.37]|uniref:Uncharacterized protein n=1 Tax=Fonsecaea pedrosoi CBS 271.37 TaxID=1442368 RepID=A0A0D2FDA2_9EURO|nr:uncharacterized protein Z517_03857 [Fonsecaea pedrosoi CBS 271.37]KIW84607.1 hypothetical protein Z517_03857 [Fonsecaea pedrosoi CBS 271.37]